jgi:hypothetical protein
MNATDFPTKLVLPSKRLLDGAQLSIDELRALFVYEPATGALKWKKRTHWRMRDDLQAGTMAKHGYREIMFGGKKYYVHRIAWAMTYGEWPSEIDHINRDRLDNRLANLRQVTSSQNKQNRRIQSNNTSGHPGVVYHRASGLWHVWIKRGGVVLSFGYSRSKEDAIRRRIELEAIYYECAPDQRTPAALTAGSAESASV